MNPQVALALALTFGGPPAPSASPAAPTYTVCENCGLTGTCTCTEDRCVCVACRRTSQPAPAVPAAAPFITPATTAPAAGVGYTLSPVPVPSRGRTFIGAPRTGLFGGIRGCVGGS